MKHPRSGWARWAAPLLVVGLCGPVRAGEASSGASSPSLTERPVPLSAPPAPRPGKRSHDGCFLRVALGPAYLDERWSPSGGAPGATYAGWGSSFEISARKSVRPGLIVGGRWQFAAVVDPNESYLGATTAVVETARFLDVIGAFADYYPNPRRGLHLGGAVGAVIATNLDTGYHAHETSWGPAISAHVGYEVFFASRWSVGAQAQLLAYHYSTTEAGVSSASDGLLPTLAGVFTFN